MNYSSPVVQDPDALRLFQKPADARTRASAILLPGTIVAIDRWITNHYHKNLYRVRYIGSPGSCATGWADTNTILVLHTGPARLPLATRAIRATCYPATAQSPAAAIDFSLDGVRPGMTRDQAVAALRHGIPGIHAYDFYSGPGMGALVTYPRSQVRPADVRFFSKLVAARVGSELDLQMLMDDPCRGNDTTKIIRVIFTPDLLKPSVALVDDNTTYCSGDTTVMSAIGALYAKFSRHPTRESGIREDGLRLVPDAGMTSGTTSFLEWRSASPASNAPLRNQVEVPMIDAWGNYAGFGNPRAGLAAHAELSPVSAGSNYIHSVRTVVWDDSVMFQLPRRQQVLWSTLDRMDITISQLHTAAVRKSVMDAVRQAH